MPAVVLLINHTTVYEMELRIRTKYARTSGSKKIYLFIARQKIIKQIKNNWMNNFRNSCNSQKFV